MNLKSLDFEIEWATDMPVMYLRSHLLHKLRLYGEPLRWAITSSKPSEDPKYFRKLTVEAVVILP